MAISSNVRFSIISSGLRIFTTSRDQRSRT
jgi:hypothetical protein